MPRTLRFYYDFISPNAYLAWTQLFKLADRYGLQLDLQPVLFAALLQASERSGPAEIPRVRPWMMLNCMRKAHALDVPFGPPHSHPFNPLLALRIATAAESWEQRRRCSDVLFRAAWADGIDMGDREALGTYLDTHGLDAAAAIEAAATDAVKQQLRVASEAAAQAEVFGVPSMCVDRELFWGYDDFPQLERYLSGETPLNIDALKDWRDVRPSAQRRR